MVSTVTTTVAAAAAGGILSFQIGIWIAVSLIILLVAKELTGSYLLAGDTAPVQARHADKCIQAGIAPLVFTFAVLVLERIQTLLL